MQGLNRISAGTNQVKPNRQLPDDSCAVACDAPGASCSSGAPLDIADLLNQTAVEAAHLESKLCQHAKGEVLVRLERSSGGVVDFAESYGCHVKESIPMPGVQRNASRELLLIQLPESMSTAQAITVMSHDPRVAYAVTNDILHANRVAAEPPAENLPPNLSSKLWGMNNSKDPNCDIDAGKAWAITTGKRDGEVIAVLDSGIDYTHKALASNMWSNPKDGSHGFNVLNGSNDPMDDYFHGTHCAGTIAANGQDGVYGVNHQASVMAVKFLDKNGNGKLSDAIKAINFAEENGARVMSNSWGGGSYNQALKDALEGSSALQVFAAGNDSNNNDRIPSYPSSYQTTNMLSVAATTRTDGLARFSNYGPKTVDLGAPGAEIWSTVPGDRYKLSDGTSMAAPMVAGAAIEIVNQFPGISNRELKSRILLNVDEVKSLKGKVASGGRLNLAASLKTDNIAPGSVTQLKVAEQDRRTVKLSWVAGGDDGNSGTAGLYQIRVSDKPILDLADFEQAREVTSGRPAESGQQQELALQFQPAKLDRRVYLAVQVTDHVGLTSGISAVDTVIPAAKLVFSDDKSPSNWNHDGNWGQVDLGSRTGVWTDSPAGDYANDVNSVLVSKPISLKDSVKNRLNFELKSETEQDVDHLFVEVSKDGKSWSTLSSFSGTTDWNTYSLDLSRFDGSDVRFRFRMNTDSSSTRDGVYLDNVNVFAD